MQQFMLSSDEVAQAFGTYLMDTGRILDNTIEDYILIYKQFENNSTVVSLYTKEEAQEEGLV